MKLEDGSSTELQRASYEVRTELGAKLGVSLLGFLQKAMLGSLSASLNQCSLSHWFAHQGRTDLRHVCDLFFESVDKLDIVRTG